MGQQFTVLDFNAMPMNGQADIAIAGNFLGGQKEGISLYSCTVWVIFTWGSFMTR